MRKALYVMGILDDSDVEWLAKQGTTKFVPSGTVLIRESNPIEDIYIVLDGKLSVLAKALGDTEIASLLAGEIVGEISFVDSRPPSSSVTASHDAHVLVIPRNILSNKLKTDNAFSARFYKAIATVLADRLRKTVSHLGYGKWNEQEDPDELDGPLMECVSMGASRFDRLLKQLRIN
jgi:CRP/FNR family transcriptional regulator, cyclic AMP receptor protein